LPSPDSLIELYDKGLYSKVKEGLMAATSETIENLTEYIQKDMEMTLDTMEMNLNFFLNARKIEGEKDDDIENLI
jgi:hypothetical protein